MPGLVRRLNVDVSRLEQHARNLIVHAEADGFERHVVCADVRANAYGHSLAIVKPVLMKSGFSHFLTDDGCSAADHSPAHVVIEAEKLYGVAVDESGKSSGGFTSFIGEVVNVKRVPAGQRISYGYTYATASESTVALIALGYADGVARRASNIASIRIGEQTGIIAGRIAMDQLVVDMNDAPVAIGDEAIVWGSVELGHPSLMDLAALTGIPPLALTSLVGYRVERKATTS